MSRQNDTEPRFTKGVRVHHVRQNDPCPTWRPRGRPHDEPPQPHQYAPRRNAPAIVDHHPAATRLLARGRASQRATAARLCTGPATHRAAAASPHPRRAAAASHRAQLHRQPERMIMTGQMLGQQWCPGWNAATPSRRADERDFTIPALAHGTARGTHDLLSSLRGADVIALVADHDDGRKRAALRQTRDHALTEVARGFPHPLCNQRQIRPKPSRSRNAGGPVRSGLADHQTRT
ncbi:MAG: hypothetical protein RL685_1006 [Pseudomonadota bacterium]|jgi:hypothetical protein